MIRAIIFDLFGVIRPDRVTAAYRHFGGDPDKDAEFIANTISTVNHGQLPSSREVFAKHFGITPEEWMAVITNGAANDPAVLAYCKQLRVTYKVGLLSNIGADVFGILFGPGELEQCFDATVASGAIGHAKPEPEAYQAIADKLAVAPTECVMIDDQPAYCDGARAIGMQAIQYKNLAQLRTDLDALLTKTV